MSVNEILKESTFNTQELLKRELEIKLSELMEEWHFASLEKIFIENRIYRKIEDCETWEAVIKTIDKGLAPFKKQLKREVTEEDIVRLTEIKIKRISKFDSFKADEHIKDLNAKMKEVKENLANLTQFTINYFKELLRKYGKGRERKTQIADQPFEQIEARRVVINNTKLYVNREEGFAGYGLKKDEFVCECSDLDDIIAFSGDGKMMVSRIDEKKYFGKDIKHIAVFNKEDATPVYNMIYRDGLKGNIMVKRFQVSGVTRDKFYDLTKGNENSKVLYFSVTDVNTVPQVDVILKPRPKLRNTVVKVNFAEVGIKNRSAIGNIVTKFPVQKVQQTGKETVTVPLAAMEELTPKPEMKAEKKPAAKDAPPKKKSEPVKNETDKQVQIKLEI
jgi:topoisomerase-4 subunit A